MVNIEQPEPWSKMKEKSIFTSKWIKDINKNDLKPSQNAPKHLLFKLCKYHEKINGRFFA